MPTYRCVDMSTVTYITGMDVTELPDNEEH